MKKYLLLLVLAISSATCFAQQHQSSISIQKEQTEEEQITEILENVGHLTHQTDDIFYAIQTFMAEGNLFLMDFLDELKLLRDDMDNFLEEYYPERKTENGTYAHQYVGGLTIDIAEQKLYEYQNHFVGLWKRVEYSCNLYHTYFVPFNTEYTAALDSLDELADKTGNYSINIQEYYNTAIEYLKFVFDTLFKEAEDAMYGLSMDDTYLERVSALRINMDHLEFCAELATTTYKEFASAKDIIESECPDVKEYYLSHLFEEEYKYDHIINGYPLPEVIFDDEQTASYMNSLFKSADMVKYIVEEAKAAQERYKLCCDALNDATAAIDEMQATVENECPDVWTDYTYDWDTLRSGLNNLTYLMSEAALNSDSTKDFFGALTELLNQAKEISDKAHAAQSGFTGVDGIAVSGNDDAVYYNINGVKVSDAAAGTVLIKVDSNGKTQKVVVR